jgi:hypothetical protein
VTETPEDEAARLRDEVAQLREVRAEAIVQRVVYAEAPRLGLIDAEIAVKLLDRSLLVFDDEGRPLNVMEALEVLAKSSPYLTGVQPQPTDPYRVAEARARASRPMRFHSG